jgi:hypothetical protein
MVLRSITFVVFEVLRILNDFIILEIQLYYIDLVLCNTTEYMLVGVIMYSIQKMQKLIKDIESNQLATSES